MNITYIVEGMYSAGGIERVISTKANWLASNTQHNITIITFAQSETLIDYFSLDTRVKRVKWQFNNSNFLVDLQHKLEDWLKNNPQDICISAYGREFGILPKLKDNSLKFVEFHFCHDINKQWSLSHGMTFLSKMIGIAKTIKMRRIAKRYDKIVVLTQSDFKKWNNAKTVCICNPVTINPPSAPSTCSEKRIIALGRMDKQKGFDFLISCWGLIENKYPDWRLDIFGNGNSIQYNEQISNLHLKNIKIHSATQDVCSEYLKSSIYVLSSRYEGFSLTICEAMSCGLPIVTFDCPSGPAELVTDGKNGYVIEDVGDIKKMAERITDLIENEHRRKEFGKNSFLMSKKYQIDSVMRKWVLLFEGTFHANNE